MVLRMVSSDTSAVVLKISSRAAIGFGARSHKRERRKDGEIDRTEEPAGRVFPRFRRRRKCMKYSRLSCSQEEQMFR